MVMHLRKPENEDISFRGSKKKNSEKDLSKIEVSFAEGKEKMKSLMKIKLQKCLNVRAKLDMKQLQIEY